jgi:radical SAM superfamily enzyme YgiQ (UPF0313 family)
MGYKVVLTADCTLASAYNGSMFVGFAACFPRVLPKSLYTRLFCPPQPKRTGSLQAAPCGLRKIEAALLSSGIPAEDIAIAHPERLHKAVGPETKVVGVSTSDPCGLGPASSTFSSLLGRETYTAFFFRKLMTDPALTSSNAKVIVGGPGVWQLADERRRSEFGIDCAVEGEGELVSPRLFRDALEGRRLPERVSGGPVPVDMIPTIGAPTINGTVEISRGCGRGCEFCNPNMRVVRHMPMERILDEVRVNLSHSDKITLHAEDVLRYRAKGMRPERSEVMRLFESVGRMTDNFGMSHLALSSALAEPRLVNELCAFSGASEGRRTLYAQTGIETGSPELVSRHMKGKAKPFQPQEWPDVVREAFKLLSDNNFVVCGTLVLGMPGETRDDVTRTLELVEDLRPHRSLIVPLFFVPLGDLGEGRFFRPEAMFPEHWKLLAACIRHDCHWAGVLMNQLFSQNGVSATRANLFRLAAWYMQRRLKESLELMEEGKDPRSQAENGAAGDDIRIERGMGTA